MDAIITFNDYKNGWAGYTVEVFRSGYDKCTFTLKATNMSTLNTMLKAVLQSFSEVHND